MYRDLTLGSISRSLILFALPMIAGNLLQQFYNIADTLIVGRALGSRSAGRRRLRLHADDLSDLHFSRAVHGFRGAFFHLTGDETMTSSSAAAASFTLSD